VRCAEGSFPAWKKRSTDVGWRVGGGCRGCCVFLCVCFSQNGAAASTHLTISLHVASWQTTEGVLHRSLLQLVGLPPRSRRGPPPPPLPTARAQVMAALLRAPLSDHMPSDGVGPDGGAAPTLGGLAAAPGFVWLHLVRSGACASPLCSPH
jgi:hypothetical protein